MNYEDLPKIFIEAGASEAVSKMCVYLVKKSMKENGDSINEAAQDCITIIKNL